MSPMEKVFRPWGSFHVVYQDSSITVKVLTVYPGERLSIQYHRNRSEYWTPIDTGLQAFLYDWFSLEMGTFIRIPPGTVHSLRNPTSEPCNMLEVSVGDHDEDDIVRVEDLYGRS
jgi:mannose-6-phosphate isomerase